MLGPGSAIGFSLVDRTSSVERLTYAAESKVRILVLPKDIFKQEISGLQGSNMKTRHRGTINALKQQFLNRLKFYPGRTKEAVRTRNVVNHVSDVGSKELKKPRGLYLMQNRGLLNWQPKRLLINCILQKNLRLMGKRKWTNLKIVAKERCGRKKLSLETNQYTKVKSKYPGMCNSFMATSATVQIQTTKVHTIC